MANFLATVDALPFIVQYYAPNMTVLQISTAREIKEFWVSLKLNNKTVIIYSNHGNVRSYAFVVEKGIDYATPDGIRFSFKDLLQNILTEKNLIPHLMTLAKP